MLPQQRIVALYAFLPERPTDLLTLLTPEALDGPLRPLPDPLRDAVLQSTLRRLGVLRVRRPPVGPVQAPGAPAYGLSYVVYPPIKPGSPCTFSRHDPPPREQDQQQDWK